MKEKDIEVGKYHSLGNGIQIRKSKDGTFTYYHSYRDKQTKKVKREKIFSKDKYLQKNFKEAVKSIKIKEEPENKPIPYIDNSIYTINILSEMYFESRKFKMISELKQEYNHLDEYNFYENKNVKKKLSNLKKETQRYIKHISHNKISNIDIKKLQKPHINIFIDKELPNKGLSQKSVSIIVSLIKTILNFSVREGYIDTNPFHYIQIKNPKRKRVRSLHTDELKLLLNECKEYKSNFNVYLSVYLGVLTAGRVRTILNIRKKDIDIKNRQIRLNNFKSNKYYVLKLNKEAIEWLDKKILQHIGVNDYLLRNLNNKDTDLKTNNPQPLSKIPNKVYKIMDELFNKHLDKSNNYDRDYVVNFHTIRRSVATNLALQGSSIYDIMTLLNHSSIKQTQDYLSLDNNTLSTETDKFLSSVFN